MTLATKTAVCRIVGKLETEFKVEQSDNTSQEDCERAKTFLARLRKMSIPADPSHSMLKLVESCIASHRTIRTLSRVLG